MVNILYDINISKDIHTIVLSQIHCYIIYVMEVYVKICFTDIYRPKFISNFEA